MHDLLPLFSSPVYSTSLDLSSQPDLATVDMMPFSYAEISQDNHILDQPAWQPIRQQILQHLQQLFYQELDSHPEVDIQITLSWVNRYTQGQYQPRHYHAAAAFTGVLFLTDHAQGLDLWSARRPLITWQQRPNILNTASWRIPAERGRLIIMPADLDHSTDPVVSGTRWTLAFDAAVVGQLFFNEVRDYTIRDALKSIGSSPGIH